MSFFFSMGGAVGFCAFSWIGSRELIRSVTGSTNWISSSNCQPRSGILLVGIASCASLILEFCLLSLKSSAILMSISIGVTSFVYFCDCTMIVFHEYSVLSLESYTYVIGTFCFEWLCSVVSHKYWVVYFYVPWSEVLSFKFVSVSCCS